VQLEHRAPERVGEGGRVGRLAAFARGGVGALGVGRTARSGQHQRRAAARGVGLDLLHRAELAGAHRAPRVQPGQVGDLGPIAHDGGGLGRELGALHLARDQLARQTHELLLVADQAQGDLLLRDLGITAHGVGLALDLLVAQSPERGGDGSEEQQDRDQRADRGQAVLPGRRQSPPPSGEEAVGPGHPGRLWRKGQSAREHSLGIIEGWARI
jgi:hypothetical protein